MVVRINWNHLGLHIGTQYISLTFPFSDFNSLNCQGRGLGQVNSKLWPFLPCQARVTFLPVSNSLVLISVCHSNRSTLNLHISTSSLSIQGNHRLFQSFRIQNSSRNFPLCNSKVISTFVGVCESSTPFPGTEIGTHFLRPLPPSTTNFV